MSITISNDKKILSDLVLTKGFFGSKISYESTYINFADIPA